ncbi:hypothetical protein DFP72DRAFT_1048058 [Ephemerocybe angulata]|uniref:Uncharacterized protein n=1 Tax=Ephemerocybe angulata TaxID=980116 RepID=A0A8H6M1H6_9AGAR|nr:hypothetical protein DFP72DRAFT_1048058 [Tulosesus angulatus]
MKLGGHCVTAPSLPPHPYMSLTRDRRRGATVLNFEITSRRSYGLLLESPSPLYSFAWMLDGQAGESKGGFEDNEGDARSVRTAFPHGREFVEEGNLEKVTEYRDGDRREAEAEELERRTETDPPYLLWNSSPPHHHRQTSHKTPTTTIASLAEQGGRCNRGDPGANCATHGAGTHEVQYKAAQSTISVLEKKKVEQLESLRRRSLPQYPWWVAAAAPLLQPCHWGRRFLEGGGGSSGGVGYGIYFIRQLANTRVDHCDLFNVDYTFNLIPIALATFVAPLFTLTWCDRALRSSSGRPLVFRTSAKGNYGEVHGVAEYEQPTRAIGSEWGERRAASFRCRSAEGRVQTLRGTDSKYIASRALRRRRGTRGYWSGLDRLELQREGFCSGLMV